MAKQSVKSQNKQIKRRLKGLRSKCYQYGRLRNIDLALIIHNGAKNDSYIYKSRKSFLPQLEQMVRVPSSFMDVRF
jgi:hypothetical protein